ncbi:MAG: MFS transporter [Candidatus Binatus sp.]|uniref:MFS transporter n=1 Tax=Candidatus Binatus sp. TaxID=2811406 RepID=UPI00271E6610|nr:MFS transporter [Candidatus Binatus sp.]MDO8431011.1 MFS transporter [Candidatus Binatus sp.]
MDNRSARSARPQRLPRNIIALGIVSLFNDTAGDMINPLLPAFVASVGGGPEVLGIIEGIADASASLFQLASGYIADRVGRLKATTFVGYAVAAVVRPLLAVTAVWWQILLVRFGDRLGKAVRGAPRDRLIADAAPSEIRGRAFGYHSAMDNAGALGGPLIAYWMLTLGMNPRSIFAWTVVPGLLSLLVLGGGVQEIESIGHERVEIGIPEAPGFRQLLAAIFVFTLGSSSDSFLLWRAREVGVSAAHLPLLWFVLAFSRVISSTPGGALSDRWGRNKTIISGWLIYSAVYLGFAFVSAPQAIWLLFAVYGFFSGLTEGSERALVIDLVAEEWRGRALGASKAAVGVALFPASVIFGIIYQHLGAEPAFMLGAALALIAIFMLPSSAPPAKPGT